MVFSARLRFDAARHIDGIRTNFSDRFNDVVRTQPACKYQREMKPPLRFERQFPIEALSAASEFVLVKGVKHDRVERRIGIALNLSWLQLPSQDAFDLCEARLVFDWKDLKVPFARNSKKLFWVELERVEEFQKLRRDRFLRCAEGDPGDERRKRAEAAQEVGTVPNESRRLRSENEAEGVRSEIDTGFRIVQVRDAADFDSRHRFDWEPSFLKIELKKPESIISQKRNLASGFDNCSRASASKFNHI